MRQLLQLFLLRLLLLDELLGRLEVLEGDALRGAAGLPDPLGVRLALGLGLLVADWGDEGSGRRWDEILEGSVFTVCLGS